MIAFVLRYLPVIILGLVILAVGSLFAWGAHKIQDLQTEVSKKNYEISELNLEVSKHEDQANAVARAAELSQQKIARAEEETHDLRLQVVQSRAKRPASYDCKLVPPSFDLIYGRLRAIREGQAGVPAPAPVPVVPGTDPAAASQPVPGSS